jgi:hypothetical protein
LRNELKALNNIGPCESGFGLRARLSAVVRMPSFTVAQEAMLSVADIGSALGR